MSSRVSSVAVVGQFLRYILVGAIAFFIDVTLLLWLSKAGVHYLAANTAAFLIANLFNFLAAHWFVFGAQRRTSDWGRLYLTVVGISVVGVLINDLLVYVGVDLLAIPLLASKVMATSLTLLWNFFARKRLAYY